MRPLTEIASIDPMPWEPFGSHGIKRKLLSHDPESGAVSQYVHIPPNWRGGGVAHYHSGFEEAYIIEGDVSLVSEEALVTGSYLYRPADVVHGHDERADAGCLCVIRMGGEPDLILVPEPTSPTEYPLGEITDPRGHVLHLRTPDMQWQGAGKDAGRFSLKMLSEAPDTGAYSALVKLPPGWRGKLETGPGFSREWFILEGSWYLADGSYFGPLSYRYDPAGSPEKAAASTAEGCTVLTWREPNTSAV